MLRVIVNVRHDLDPGEADLEVPAEVKAVELDRLVSLARQWDKNGDGQELRHSIYVESLARFLQSYETLAKANVWDGAQLRFDTFTAAYFRTSADRKYPLYRASVTLGRANLEEEDDAFINLVGEPQTQTISRRHAQVFYTKGQWQIVHLSQTNETSFEQQILTFGDRLTLVEGSQLQLGAVKLSFHFG